MASAPAGGTAADLADALLGQEALLFSRKFTKEKAGDHVNEVSFQQLKHARAGRDRRLVLGYSWCRC